MREQTRSAINKVFVVNTTFSSFAPGHADSSWRTRGRKTAQRIEGAHHWVAEI